MERDGVRSGVDLAIVGAGIVGLATARAAMSRWPGARLVVLEKEAAIARHQTGRNSGVIHAGVYYRPGSEKARLCSAGREAMVAYCRERGIAHRVCGKLVVATEASEEPRLQELERRCQANGVRVRAVGAEELRDIEPHAAGRAALHVLDTGTVDFGAVAQSFADEVTAAGGEIRLGTAVTSGRETADGVTLETLDGAVTAKRVVACAGLHADRVARAISGPSADGGMRIIPFRGEYYELRYERAHLVRSLIYPVPDPRFPFLGVHLTRGIDSRVRAGPNAVLALRREGYGWRQVSLRELGETLSFPGFRRMARAHWRYGLSEMARSLSRARLALALQRLVPEVEAGDLVRAAAGVRAQAVTADGSLVADFAFRRTGRVLHVLNAPSPAATASIAIGNTIAERLELLP
jgi:L-2-hydroxyglutarate oxidase